MTKIAGRVEFWRLVVAITGIVTITILLIFLWYSGRLVPIYYKMIAIFTDKEHLRLYVESWGSRAPLAFIGIQVFQVVFAPIPGELTGAVGGFLFGTMSNIIYSTIGLTVGSILAFLGARLLGMPFVNLFVSQATLDKFHWITERKGALVALILFAIPGFPKDIFSYLLGLSPMRFLVFLVVCTVGRLPGTIMLSYSGSAVYEENWTMLGIMTLLCILAFVLVYFFKGRIEEWLKYRGGEKPSKPAESIKTPGITNP